MEHDDQAPSQATTSGPDPEQATTGAAGATPEPPSDAPATGDESPAGIDPELEGHHLLELWSDREEIHALPEILRPAEGLVAVGSGTVVRSGRLASSKWLVVLTDRRLLCIKGRASVTRKVIDMPVSQVRSVDVTGIFGKTLTLDTGYGTLRVGSLKKGFAHEMEEGLGALMEAYGSNGGEKSTALPRADLSRVGPGHTHEELEALQGAVDEVRETVAELTDRIVFLEELVRSNVAAGDVPGGMAEDVPGEMPGEMPGAGPSAGPGGAADGAGEEGST